MALRHPLHQLHESDFEASDSGHRWLDLVRGYVLDIRMAKVSIDPPSMLPGSTAVVSATVEGVKVGDDVIQICKPSLANGVFVAHGIVVAADTLSILFVNSNSGVIDEPEEEYTITYIKNTRP